MSSISGCCPPWRCRLLTQRSLWLWSISICWRADLDDSYRHTSVWCKWDQCLQLYWKAGPVSCIVFMISMFMFCFFFIYKDYYYECWPLKWTLDGAVSHSDEWVSTCNPSIWFPPKCICLCRWDENKNSIVLVSHRISSSFPFLSFLISCPNLQIMNPSHRCLPECPRLCCYLHVHRLFRAMRTDGN